MNTKNESFLQMSKLLKSRGVENNKFMLRLDNRKLIDIDPYDENLTTEQKLMIIDECRHNVWYFLREVIKVRENNDDHRYHFRLNLSTCAFIWLYSIQISSMIQTPRQQFATLTLRALKFHTEYLSVYEVNNDERYIDSRIVYPDYLIRVDMTDLRKIDKEIRYINDFEERINIEVKNKNKTADDIFEILKSTILSDMQKSPIYINTVILHTITGRMNTIYSILDYYNLPFKDYMYDLDPTFFDTITVPIMVKYPAEDIMTDEGIDHLKKCLENDEEVIEREIYMRRNTKKAVK
jgi:hypothetical protein